MRVGPQRTGRRTGVKVAIAAGLTLALGASRGAAETLIVGPDASPCLNVRSVAEADGPVVACIEPGTTVELLARGPIWLRLRLADGSEGWAVEEYLVPVPAAAPEPAPAPTVPPAPPAEEGPKLTRITFDIPFPEEQGGGSATGSAETLETVGEDLVVASGGVEIKYLDMRLQAQRVEVNRSTKLVRAEGEVILDQGPRRITGTSAEMDLETRTGKLTDARAFADPDIYFTGAEVEMLGDDVYRLKDGQVTSCIKENPGWSFRASKARIKLEGFARVKNTTMRVKSLPLLYLPYMLYPAKSDRAAGLLFPNLGLSGDRGSYLGLAYFQPFGPSYDTTLYLDLYTENLVGVGTEFRYRPSAGTAGWFEAYAIEDTLVDDVRWKVSWDHTSALPLGLKAVARLRDFSDFQFFRDFERDFNNITIRRIESSAFLTGNWGSHSLNLLLNQNEAFISRDVTVVGRQLPEIEYRLRSTQLGRLPIYLELLSSVNNISVERTGLIDETYSRADLYPQLTIPLSTLPWLSVSVTGGERVTWYGKSVGEDPSTLDGGSLTRSFPTASAQIVGPSFSRIFDVSIGPFAKFKHIFEPRWGYQYIGEFEDQELVPLFDEVDVLTATNIFGYALVNRLLAKPADEAARGGPREILSFEISQAFSLDDQVPLQASRDGTLETTEGPLGARLRFNPSAQASVEVRALYSTLFSNLVSTSLSGSLRFDRQTYGASWFTRYDAETGEERSDQLRLSVTFELLPRRLSVGSQVAYDVLNDFVQQHRHGLQFTGQCWGFRLDYTQFRSSTRDDYDVRFALNLKNIGTFLDLTGGSRGGQF